MVEGHSLSNIDGCRGCSGHRTGPGFKQRGRQHDDVPAGREAVRTGTTLEAGPVPCVQVLAVHGDPCHTLIGILVPVKSIGRSGSSRIAWV